MSGLSEKEQENAMNEVRLLASIHNANVIQYNEAFSNGQPPSQLCIIMEFANDGDLYQRIIDCQKKGILMEEKEVWSIFIQIVKGLKALHDMKIYHRDLKSANIFMNLDKTVKLGDMNVSKVAKQILLHTQTGTPYYASPEVWKDLPYDSKSDIWSLGCVLYEMTTLKPPFRAEDMEELFKKVTKGSYPKIPAFYSKDLSMVIKAMLQVDSHFRPSCDKILSLPSVIQRMDDKILVENDDGLKIMLQTINVSKNMNNLSDKFPKANYTPLKMMVVDRSKYIQNLNSNDIQLPQINKTEDEKIPSHREFSMMKKKKKQQNSYVQSSNNNLSSILDIQGIMKVLALTNQTSVQKAYGNEQMKKLKRKKMKVVHSSVKLLTPQKESTVQITLEIDKQNQYYRLPAIAKRYRTENQSSLKHILQSANLIEELKSKYRKKNVSPIN